MRKGLLGLAAAATIGFGALTYSELNAIRSLPERNRELESFKNCENHLQMVQDNYANISPLRQLRDGPDFVEHYNELLEQRNRLREVPAVQEGIEEGRRHGGNILGCGLMTLLSTVAGVGAFFSKKKKSEE